MIRKINVYQTIQKEMSFRFVKLTFSEKFLIQNSSSKSIDSVKRSKWSTMPDGQRKPSLERVIFIWSGKYEMYRKFNKYVQIKT